MIHDRICPSFAVVYILYHGSLANSKKKWSTFLKKPSPARENSSWKNHPPYNMRHSIHKKWVAFLAAGFLLRIQEFFRTSGISGGVSLGICRIWGQKVWWMVWTKPSPGLEIWWPKKGAQGWPKAMAVPQIRPRNVDFCTLKSITMTSMLRVVSHPFNYGKLRFFFGGWWGFAIFSFWRLLNITFRLWCLRGRYSDPCWGVDFHKLFSWRSLLPRVEAGPAEATCSAEDAATIGSGLMGWSEAISRTQW